MPSIISKSADFSNSAPSCGCSRCVCSTTACSKAWPYADLPQGVEYLTSFSAIWVHMPYRAWWRHSWGKDEGKVGRGEGRREGRVLPGVAPYRGLLPHCLRSCKWRLCTANKHTHATYQQDLLAHNKGHAPWRAYQQNFLAHDKGHAHADLPHGLQAHCDLLRPSTVVHKLVAQVPHDGLQTIGWHQVMACLYRHTRAISDAHLAVQMCVLALDV